VRAALLRSSGALAVVAALVALVVAACDQGGTLGATGADAAADTSPAGSDDAASGDGSSAHDAGLADTAPPDAAAACSPDAVAGLAVASAGTGFNPLDPLGYPPYALDGCTLVYAAPGGDLRLRDLSTGAETPLAPASEQPRRPAIAGDLVAWEAVVGGASLVRVSRAGQTTTIAGPFDHAGEPRVTGDAVVFTAWLTADDAGDTDVYLYLPASAQLVAVATGWGQQRFADVSPASVAVSDFSEDPTGAFSDTTHRDADVVVFDRATLAKTVRHLPGKQAFPMLGPGQHLAYLDWGLVTPEPKFSAYVIRLGLVPADPTTDANVKGSGQVTVNTPYTRPSVRGAFIEWIDESSGAGGLFRAPLDLSSAPTSTLGGLPLLGPVAGQPLTVVGTAGDPVLLRGVAR